jgi:hypothetical protein
LNGREAAGDHKKVALIMPPNGLIEGYGGAVIDRHMISPQADKDSGSKRLRKMSNYLAQN